MDILKQQLLAGDKRIGVWGTGFIGFSSMANFAVNGVKIIGRDVDEALVNRINKGEIPIPNLDYWLGFDIKPLVESGMMRATLNKRDLLQGDVAVHLVCIPTEKGGRPYDDILKAVIRDLASLKKVEYERPPLVIIESTLTPNRTDSVIVPIFEEAGLKVGKDVLLGVAPRRDWFISPEKSLKKLPRVVGGTTPETTRLMAEVLGIVCDHIVPAPDHRHAEIVKSIENAYRHVEITLANELSLAYPDMDMKTILELVGTKWNIGTYHPSFGTGGYCIPLSSQYVLLGAKSPEALTILNSTIDFDKDLPLRVAESLQKRGSKRVGILGLSYKGDIKVHILSPAIKMVKALKERGIGVKVHDPYYSPSEIRRIVDTDTFDFPKGMKEFDTILIVANHRQYLSTPIKDILDSLKKCKLILDNADTWKKIQFPKGIEYHLAGDKNWLG